MSENSNRKKIGVIAGFGDFPIEVCKRARSKDYQIFLCAVQGEASPAIEGLVDLCIWVKLGQIGKLLTFYKENNVSEAVLCGKIHKFEILSGKVIPDFDAVKMITGIRNYKDDSLLNAFCDYLGKKGISIIDSTFFLKDDLMRNSLLTKNKPSKDQMNDVIYGFQIAKQIAGLDIGQTVIVKNKSVVAVESVEGTDEAIIRGGRLAEKGAVAVKVAKPNQDMRFDVPTIGPSTIDACIKSNISVLAFEAGKTIVLHPDLVTQSANRAGISIISYCVNNESEEQR